MRHLSIVEYGTFLGLRSERIQVRKDDSCLLEAPLSRLCTITVARKGVGLSSDLVLACAARGIRIFFTDFRGAQLAALMGSGQHGTTSLRRRQFSFIASPSSRDLARSLVLAKIGNQRALLKYMSRYHEAERDGPLGAAIEHLGAMYGRLRATSLHADDWLPSVLGHEGEAASAYFRALREAALLPSTFVRREGRGSREVTNAALNLGYAMLQTRIWTVLSNAGLECYAGVLHQDRPGKPSLVLDVMEEHRAFLVDRVILKLRPILQDAVDLDAATRKRIVEGVNEAMDRTIPHRGRKLRIDTVLQRQAYRLAGHFAGEQRYRPVRYPW